MYSVCGRKDVTSWSSFVDVTVSKWISIRRLILSIRKRVVQQSPTAHSVCVENWISLRIRFLKQRNHPKMWHPFRRLSNRNCVKSAIHIKSDKNNFTCIQCGADKNVSKHYIKLTRWRTSWWLQFINYSIKVCYTQFIEHSSNAVIFAAN